MYIFIMGYIIIIIIIAIIILTGSSSSSKTELYSLEGWLGFW